MEREKPVENVTSCAACGSRRFRALGTPGHWIGRQVFESVRDQIGLCRCRECGFTFVNPRPAERLLAAFYASSHYSCHDPNDGEGTAHKAEHLLAMMGRALPGARRVLDYGCGGGLLLRRARALGIEAVGYDVGERALRTCAAQGLTVSDRLEDLPSHAFDAVILHHVFEHLTRHGEALRGVAKLLRPTGAVLIEVPNAASLRARLSLPPFSRYLNFDERYRAYPIHLSYFSPKSLARLLDRHAFVVRHMTTYGLGLDELIANRESPDEAYGQPAHHDLVRAGRKLGRPARELVKRTLFAAGLGENLFALASPARAA